MLFSWFHLDFHVKAKQCFLTFEPIDVAVHIISLICWPQTIGPNTRLIPKISSTFISRENNGIPKKNQRAKPDDVLFGDRNELHLI